MNKLQRLKDLCAPFKVVPVDVPTTDQLVRDVSALLSLVEKMHGTISEAVYRDEGGFHANTYDMHKALELYKQWSEDNG